MKRTALVTGGAHRIGKAIVLELGRMGFNIALHYHRSEQDAKKVARQVEKQGVRCHLFQCDFSNMNEVHELIPRVIEVFPDLNVLINSVSLFEKATLLSTNEDLFDRMMTVNLKVPLFLTRDFAHHAKKGSVINIVDTKIARTLFRYFVYTLTKKSLLDLTLMSAKELAPGIRVNAIAPGLILPPAGKDESYLDSLSKNIPLQKKGSPEKVSQAVRFLIESDFITGECIYVDGGEHLK